jgi:hypothetical protein
MAASVPWISPLVYWFPIPEETKRKAIQFRDLGSKQYEERRVQGTDPNDIFSYLIDQYTAHE